MNIYRVSFAGRNAFRLFSSQQEMSARLAGALRHTASTLPVVGDWVEAADGLIRSVLPRRSVFSRRASGRCDEEQIIAANIDVLFVVCGLDGDYNPRRIDRYLVLAREGGVSPVVVLNKSDLRDPPGMQVDAPVVVTSTRTPGGVAALNEWIREGETVALVGSSGAGKSSILNRLLGRDHQQTQEVRHTDSRGRHTTTHRQLFTLPGGAFVIDTPGLREVQLWACESSVDAAFDDIASLTGQCRFSDCRHNGEPGCAVARAIESGELCPERWNSYSKLTGEVKRLDKKKRRKMQLQMRRYKQKW